MMAHWSTLSEKEEIEKRCKGRMSSSVRGSRQRADEIRPAIRLARALSARIGFVIRSARASRAYSRCGRFLTPHHFHTIPGVARQVKRLLSFHAVFAPNPYPGGQY